MRKLVTEMLNTLSLSAANKLQNQDLNQAMWPDSQPIGNAKNEK